MSTTPVQVVSNNRCGDLVYAKRRYTYTGTVVKESRFTRTYTITIRIVWPYSFVVTEGTTWS
ncbi:MAG: hypothetical protein QOJ59_940 [Thermomicrobiales bacterium]|jgi:hypothetical protein|nr:hypothetical protein [Thermomicrobiales bacterium]MEA2525761.1 hypothetical protein [Thermomicrobiales bacterium]